MGVEKLSNYVFRLDECVNHN